MAEKLYCHGSDYESSRWILYCSQKVKVAALKEITDTTWDRAKAGLKFSARK